MAGKISNSDVAKQLSAFIVKETIKQNKVKLQTQVVKAFEKIKREMILEFMNHPVTREILGGPNASNESGTLDGYGNLFSFIGFNEGEDPIEIILDLLNDSKIQYSNIADSVLDSNTDCKILFLTSSNKINFSNYYLINLR